MFENTTRDDRGIGDGAYLFDPQGDIRASMIYPCRIGCADPAAGLVTIDVQPRRNEVMAIRNNATWPIASRTTCSRAAPYSYAFPPGSILQPGETMRVSPRAIPTTTPSSRGSGA